MADVSEVQFTAGRPVAPKTDQAGARRPENGPGRPLHVVQPEKLVLCIS